MANELKFVLLGSPHALINNAPITGFITSKAEALLYYLATTGREHQRVALAGLLWPDASDSVARKNLRDIIFNLRKLVGDHLNVTRHTLAFNFAQPHSIDTIQLRAAAHSTPTDYAASQLQAAVALYQGDFLEGFYIREADPFEEWIRQEREQLRTALLHILHLLAAHHVDNQLWNSGLPVTQQLLTMDPSDEAAHRQQMRLLAGSGQRGAALAQYQQCKELLEREFNIAPAHETQVLYEMIRTGMVEQTRWGSFTPDFSPGQTVEDTKALAAYGFLDRDLAAIPQPAQFVGRRQELATLLRTLFEEECRLISVVGLGGQGKTALVAHFAELAAQQTKQRSTSPTPNQLQHRPQHQPNRSQQQPLQRILWYSCRNAPSLREILVYWLQQLEEQHLNLAAAPTASLQHTLLTYLQRTRCLLVLDNFESFLSTEAGAGIYQREHRELQQFLDRIITTNHRSCLIITSRELPLNLSHADQQATHMLQLHGMAGDDALHLLRLSQLDGRPAELLELTNRYSGHPLALKIMAEAIRELFMGDLTAFLQEETLFFDDIRHLLAQQFGRLSALEKEIILWLAITREATTPQQLWDSFIELPPRNRFFEAIRSLQRRSLIETDERPKRFSRQITLHLMLPAVVLEYAVDYLINEFCQELLQDEFQFLERYALVRAQDPDYIRQVQFRFLLQPIAQRLSGKWAANGQIEQQLDYLLVRLRRQFNNSPGYAAANLIHLMQQMGISLAAKDFSGLTIRQADFRRVQLTYTNLSNANLVNCTFADYFGAVLAVAFSPDNQLLASATTDGDIQIWRTSDGQLAGVCHGNGRWIWSLAFHPDGQQLVSACADHQLRIWDIGDFYIVRSHMPSAGLVIRTLSGHTNAIFSVAYSPDGKLIASGSADGTVGLWCAVDGMLKRTFTGHTAAVFAVAFDPTYADGRRLASGSRDRIAYLWDTTTGEVIQTFRGHTDEILSVAFQPNGENLLTAAWDRTARVWDVRTGNLTAQFTGPQGALLAVACHSDNDTIAVAGNDHAIYLWSIYSGKLKMVLHGHFSAVGTLAFSNDSATLASGSFDQTIRFWDSERGHALRTYHGHRNQIRPLSLSTDGQWLANGNVDHTICLWRVGDDSPPPTSDSRQPYHILRSHTLPIQNSVVLCIAFHPTIGYLASAGQDGAVRLWQIEPEPRLLREYHKQDSAILSLTFSRDGRWLATGDTDCTICLWDFEGGYRVCRPEGPSKLVETLTFTPDSKYLLSGCDGGNIYVYQLPPQHSTNQHVPEEQTPGQTIASIPTLGNSPLLASGSTVSVHPDVYQEVVSLTETATKPYQVVQTATNGINTLAVSPDGHFLAVGGAEPCVELWQFSEKKEKVEQATATTAQAHVQWQPFSSEQNGSKQNGSKQNGKLQHDPQSPPHAAASTVDDDPPMLQLVHKFSVTTSTFALAFSPDGDYLAGAGGDHKIYLWDLEQNCQCDLLIGHTGTIFTLQFAPDGQRLYSSSADETIRVWEKSAGQWRCSTTLRPPGLYAGLNIFGTTGINQEKRVALRALGAVEQSQKQAHIVPMHNLPSALTSLYGREEALISLIEKFSHPDTRLLTIWGEGGVGKTRFAIELARIVGALPNQLPRAQKIPQPPAAQFVDGIWFVSLTHLANNPYSGDSFSDDHLTSSNNSDGIEPGEQLAAAIGGVLNMIFSHDEPLTEQLYARLQQKRLLLLLDGFERLTAATETLVQLLQTAPGVNVIVTSRQRLNLVSQVAYRLRGLSVPAAGEEATLSDAALLAYPSIQLFADRMERFTGEFVLSAQNRTHIVALCRLVEGLPLGIELATTQLLTKELPEVVREVEADLAVLRSDVHDLPQEQRSLYAVFHRSWQNLPLPLQRLLIGCAIFHDGFTLEAADAVACAAKHQVQALCYRSFLSETGANRYAMHEFTRSFVIRHIDDFALWQQVGAAHAIYYLELLATRGRRTDSTAEDFQSLNEDRENIRAAWQWTIYAIEESTKAQTTLVPADLLQWITNLQGSLESIFYLYERLGHYQAIEELKAQLTTIIHRLLQDKELMLTPLNALQSTAKNTTIETSGDKMSTLGPVKSSPRTFGAVFQEIRAELLIHYGFYLDRTGDAAAAIQSFTEAVTLAKGVRAPRLEAQALYLLATQRQQEGAFAAARSLLTQVEQLAHRHDLIRWRIAAHNLRGILHDMQGNRPQAMAEYALGLPLAVADGDLYQERLLVNNMGLVALTTGHWEEARQHLERNLTLSKTLGDPTRHAFALMNHALLLDTLGLYAEAEQELYSALEIAREIHHPRAEIYILQFLATVGFHTGNNVAGREQAEESLHLIERHGLLSMKAQGLTLLAHHLLLLGEKERATETYLQAISLWQAMENQVEIYIARAGYAFAAIQLGKVEEAVATTNQILAVLDQLLEQQVTGIAWIVTGCYYILQIVNDERAAEILQKGHRHVQKQANQISDPELRTIFLNNVFSNRTIIRMVRNQ